MLIRRPHDPADHSLDKPGTQVVMSVAMAVFGAAVFGATVPRVNRTVKTGFHGFHRTLHGVDRTIHLGNEFLHMPGIAVSVSATVAM